MKITVIGGGSTYTPELVSGFLAYASSIPISELCLMDIDPERLRVVGGFAQRMAQAKGQPFRVTTSTNQRQAISGASYVITQLRVGMMSARIGDEYLGLRHNLIGQETTGVGGMAKAMRTIPVLLAIANDIRETAPGALLANFTNPAGLVTEALSRYAPNVNAIGVCNVGITTKMKFLEKYQQLTGQTINPQRASLQTLGLNHLTWHTGFSVDGEDVWSTLFPALLQENNDQPHPEWDPAQLARLNAIPNYYLQYFYYTAKKLAEQSKWPPSRGEEVVAIEEQLLKQYADPALVEPPADLMKRGGAYYSTLTTQLINSHYNDLGDVHVVNIRNNGTVPQYPADWILELPAKVNKSGITPLPAQPLPGQSYQLVSAVKEYELQTVEAAVHGDRAAARRALFANPLGPKPEQVDAVLDDLLATNQKWLPRFFTAG